MMRGLLDGNSAINVYPTELSHLLLGFMAETGLSGRFPLELGPQEFFRSPTIQQFLNHPDFDNDEYRNGLYRAYGEISAEGDDKTTSLKGLTSTLLAYFFDDPSLPTVIDVEEPNLRGYLQWFPDAKIIHLIRHPLNQLNSQFRFRYRDANRSGGEYPGRWHLRQSFEDIVVSFREAALTRSDRRVTIVRMEDLQANSKSVSEQILNFIGVAYEAINDRITNRGRSSDARSTHFKSDIVLHQENDWSCLTASDLHFTTRIPHIDVWYELESYPEAPNRFGSFLIRQLGYTGKNRQSPRNPYRFILGCLTAVAYYFQDMHHKFYLRKNLPPFDHESHG